MGRDCASERRSNRAGRGPTRVPLGPAELWGARALHPDQPQNGVAVALPRSAHGPETSEDGRIVS
jgi:hypothetical protein